MAIFGARQREIVSAPPFKYLCACAGVTDTAVSIEKSFSTGRRISSKLSPFSFIAFNVSSETASASVKPHAAVLLSAVMALTVPHFWAMSSINVRIYVPFEHVTCSLPVFSFSLYSSSVSSAICTGRASRSISMPCRASLYNLCPLTETAEYIGGTCKISPRKESSAVSSAALKTGVSSVLMTSPVTSPVVYASPNRKDAS